MKIQKVIKKHGKDLLSEYNVLAIGKGEKITNGQRTGREAMVFSVVVKHPYNKYRAYRVPKEIKGIPTDVVESGVIKVLPPSLFALEDHKKRHRPAPGGVSVGHTLVTAGTISCLVRREGKIYILSNSHVIANSGNAMPGDAIVQPGVYDGGVNPDDRIADLVEFVPITFTEGTPPPTQCPVGNGAASVLNVLAGLFGRTTRVYAAGDANNYVDAAIALPDPENVSPNIMEIGIPRGVRVAELGDTLVKSGRTTGLTTGKVDQVDVTVRVQYGDKVAVFVDQIMAGAMSQGGDSGSAVLDANKNVVGLLFAGSETTTIINRFENVIRLLKLDGVVS